MISRNDQGAVCVTPPSPHFLVVDDLPTVRHIIIALLEVLGYTRVSEAGHGSEALSLLHTRAAAGDPIDFLITDWNMPDMDGMQLVAALRSSKEWRDLPVLMVSSELGQHQVGAASDAGIDGYISKYSLSLGLLRESIDRILAAKLRKEGYSEK